VTAEAFAQWRAAAIPPKTLELTKALASLAEDVRAISRAAVTPQDVPSRELRGYQRIKAAPFRGGSTLFR